jgi:bifunctional non-homologous end joining protein LigD
MPRLGSLVGAFFAPIGFPFAFGKAYLLRMLKAAFEFCLPTRSTSVPSGPDWLHEIKNDGYRLRVKRDGDRVRLITL